jgi:hypothetical protein
LVFAAVENKIANAVIQVEPWKVPIIRDSGKRTAVGITMSTSAAQASRLSDRTVLPIFIIYIYIFFLFCTTTNKCTTIPQIITLLHASTLLCHPQGACSQSLAKVTQVFQFQLLVIQFIIKMFHMFC